MISKLAGDSTWSRYALVWSGIQAVMIIALESVILALHLKESGNIENAMNGALTALGNPELYQSSKKSILLSTRVLSVYHVLFIVAQLFQLILLCDAMFNKNTIQIIAIVAFNWAIVGYAGVQLKQASDILVETPGESLKNMILYYFRLPPAPTPYHESLPYEIAVIVLMSIFAIGFAVIAYKLYKEFGWTIYKKIGADLAMRAIIDLLLGTLTIYLAYKCMKNFNNGLNAHSK
ncbi:hypothetical protein BGZ76_002009 [Entomortierella beljakovae]|nr:hypothetical protein BGZ76_002009 [Entomortierella beljakovae]